MSTTRVLLRPLVDTPDTSGQADDPASAHFIRGHQQLTLRLTPRVQRVDCGDLVSLFSPHVSHMHSFGLNLLRVAVPDLFLLSLDRDRCV